MQEMASNDIVKRNEEIYNLLAANDIEQGIKRLMDFINDFNPKSQHLETAIKINRDFQTLITNKSLKPEAFKEQRKFLISQIFALIDSIEEDLISSS